MFLWAIIQPLHPHYLLFRLMILLLLVTHIAAEHLAAAGGALRRSLNKKPAAALLLCVMELATKVRKDFTITEKAPYSILGP